MSEIPIVSTPELTTPKNGRSGVKRTKGGKVTSRSSRAGLQFPVGRIGRFLKDGKYADRIGGGAAVYLGAILEYLTAETLELAGNAAKANKKHRITPRHLQIAIRNDEELDKLLRNVTIAHGGVLPHIDKLLLPKEKNTKRDKNKPSEETAQQQQQL